MMGTRPHRQPAHGTAGVQQGHGADGAANRERADGGSRADVDRAIGRLRLACVAAPPSPLVAPPLPAAEPLVKLPATVVATPPGGARRMTLPSPCVDAS